MQGNQLITTIVTEKIRLIVRGVKKLSIFHPQECISKLYFYCILLLLQQQQKTLIKQAKTN